MHSAWAIKLLTLCLFNNNNNLYYYRYGYLNRGTCGSIKNKTLDTTVYNKPAHTGRYVNFNFCHSSPTKQGCITGLFLKQKNSAQHQTSKKRKWKEKRKVYRPCKTRIRNQTPFECNLTSTVSYPNVTKISEEIRRTLSPKGIRNAFNSTNTLG